MGRKLQYHERKLLKKHDFMHYEREDEDREREIMRRYHVLSAKEYIMYRRAVGTITKLADRLRKLPQDDVVRLDQTTKLMRRLYDMGLVARRNDGLLAASAVNSSAFCRRRLPVVMVTLKMCQTNEDATRLVEQGHVRVGPKVITDPAFLVSRSSETQVMWVDNSKLRRAVKEYRGELDDFDML
ncbi:S4 domain [Carpediemonas membranifera]|uniref:S4 domain n=1 Tax=Carpediemonas membranifera TaxID=201153 RepID=A0A8J6AZP6_9EUKA|nr:S4 domain [Carpediemonas membranifera]|eukprot:KAG9389804.1 S4 domain [Carpediemonas membranifera]